MYLPNVQDAEVAESKVVDYLLSPTHPERRAKANFFFRFGFSRSRWHEFAEGLKRHAATYEVKRNVKTGYGVCYPVDSAIETPDGRNPQISTVWQVDWDREIPRFVTAYLLKR